MGLLTAMREDAYPDKVYGLPESGLFELTTAGTMAWAAQLAYEVTDLDKTARIIDRWGWRDGRMFSGRFASHLPLVSTKGFTAIAGKDLVIAFAGTEPTNLLNWITDFSIHRTAEGVTDGFLAGFEAVRADLEVRLSESEGGVWFTGHSLGGALCVAAAKSLMDSGHLPGSRLLGVYTIGMPRPGDAHYAQAYDDDGVDGVLGKRSFRLVYGDDIVPRVPPSGDPFDFRHVGLALMCPPGGTFAGMPNPQDPESGVGLVEDVADALIGASAEAPAGPAFPAAHKLVAELLETLPRPVRDHLPDRYLAALGMPARG